MIEISTVFSVIVVLIFVYNSYRRARKEHDGPDSLVLTFITTVLCAAVIITAFGVGYQWAQGSPREVIEPGKYIVVGAVKDESFITDSNSRTALLLTRGAREDALFYSLPTNKLQGDPQIGGILEITEMPSSQKMVFRKR